MFFGFGQISGSVFLIAHMSHQHPHISNITCCEGENPFDPLARRVCKVDSMASGSSNFFTFAFGGSMLCVLTFRCTNLLLANMLRQSAFPLEPMRPRGFLRAAHVNMSLEALFPLLAFNKYGPLLQWMHVQEGSSLCKSDAAVICTTFRVLWNWLVGTPLCLEARWRERFSRSRNCVGAVMSSWQRLHVHKCSWPSSETFCLPRMRLFTVTLAETAPAVLLPTEPQGVLKLCLLWLLLFGVCMPHRLEGGGFSSSLAVRSPRGVAGSHLKGDCSTFWLTTAAFLSSAPASHSRSWVVWRSLIHGEGGGCECSGGKTHV